MINSTRSLKISGYALRVNLIGAFMMSREAAPHRSRGGGEIVMTSSIASMTANGSSIAYCVQGWYEQPDPHPR